MWQHDFMMKEIFFGEIFFVWKQADWLATRATIPGTHGINLFSGTGTSASTRRGTTTRTRSSTRRARSTPSTFQRSIGTSIITGKFTYNLQKNYPKAIDFGETRIKLHSRFALEKLCDFVKHCRHFLVLKTCYFFPICPTAKHVRSSVVYAKAHHQTDRINNKASKIQYNNNYRQIFNSLQKLMFVRRQPNKQGTNRK